jgi:hypothetical protein
MTRTCTRGKCYVASSTIRIVRISFSTSECTPALAVVSELYYRPIRHHSNYYNCRVIAHNGFVHLVRPKLWLANDGNYRERRYFQCWRAPRYVETHDIPVSVWPLLLHEQVSGFIIYIFILSVEDLSYWRCPDQNLGHCSWFRDLRRTLDSSGPPFGYEP